MNDSDEPVPEPSPPIFQDRSRWLWAVLLALLAVAGIVVVAWRPAYGAVKRWRALEMAAEGERHMAESRWEEVSKLVRASLALAPSEPAVLRLVARFCTRNGAAQGVPYWQALLDGGQATADDRREYIRYLHDVGRMDLATPEIRKLVTEAPKDAANQLLMLDHLVLQGKWPEAIRGAEIAVAERPLDAHAKFVLAQALLGSGDPRQGLRAAGILRDLRKPSNPESLAALRALAALRGLPPEEYRELLQALEALPKATFGDRLLAVEIREFLEPARRGQIVEEFVASLPGPLTQREISSLGGFLRARDRHDLVLKMAPESVGRTNAALALIAVDALVDLKRWDEILQRLTNSPAVDLVTRQCTLALAAEALGNKADSMKLLRTAAGVALTNLNQLQIVANVAERLGDSNLVLEAWTAALEDPRTVIGAADNLIRVGAGRDDYEAERRAYRRLAQVIGPQPVVQGEAAYILALYDERVAEAHEILTAIVNAQPGAPSPRAALALAKMQLGDRPGALTVMESGGVEWDKAEPRWQAVYAAVLAANQQRSAARRMAAGIDQSRLKLLERALLDGIVSK